MADFLPDVLPGYEIKRLGLGRICLVAVDWNLRHPGWTPSNKKSPMIHGAFFMILVNFV